MPAPPELGDAGGLVGAVEVQREANIQHPRQADRHVGVAGEIEIDLQGVGERGVPRFEERQARAVGGGGESDVREAAEHVGEDEFLAQAEQKDQHAVGEVPGVGADHARGGHLRNDLGRADDRAGDQMREEGDEGAIGQHGGAEAAIAGGVDQEHDLLEGEEADRQWQGDVQRGRRRCRDVQQEVGVFEPAQQSEVGGDAGGQPGSCGRCVAQLPGDGVVPGDGGDQQRQVRRVPPGVEEQVAGDQPRERGCVSIETTKHEEAGHAERQERENECNRMEHHAWRNRRRAGAHR